MRLYVLILPLFLACVTAPAQAVILRFASGDSTVEISSRSQKKTVFLKLDEVSAKLPVTVRRDAETNLLVLCTELNCLAVFPMDKEDYLRQDGSDYVRAERVTEVLGYVMKKKGKDLSLTCTHDCAHDRVGSEIGEHAPGFQLPVRGDTIRSLLDLRRSGAVLLVFIRSGDWDPFSRELLKGLEAARLSLDSLKIRTVAIHGYAPKLSAAWQDSLELQFPLLSDDDSAVMRGYDVFDRGPLPHPAAFLIDSAGIIQYRHVYENLEAPPNIVSLLDAVKETRK